MKVLLILICIAFLTNPVTAQNNRVKMLERKALKRTEFVPSMFTEWQHAGTVTVDSAIIDPEKQTIRFEFNPTTTQIPVRDEWLKELESGIGSKLGRRFRDYQISLFARGRELHEYIPNVYRKNIQAYDLHRMTPAYSGTPLLTRLSQPSFDQGLTGSHIALWPSHGLFFDQQLDRWQWQRARLWQTVEDIFPRSFTSDFLIPMLENAGAIVLTPRERDIQTHEVIVDNNGSTGSSWIKLTGSGWDSALYKGFKTLDTIFPGVNPFQSGTSLSVNPMLSDVAVSATYVPEIPGAGEYAVTVSYPNTGNCNQKVLYSVRYSGGTESFMVNQCMSAGTWVYLGTFQFEKGINEFSGSVTITTGEKNGVIATDAVRFGGGMGNVARKCDTTVFQYHTSGRPRWMEGARYYLQYAGMPDSITYSLSKGRNDYNDDYMSRPEWVNFLIGPSKPQYNGKYATGLNIPIDLALAFHTDAGVSAGDTVIGTLGIYSTTRNNGIFPDGRDKLASRDLTDMVQTQITEDIRKQIDPQWTRRGLWDREYSEAWRPVVPAMLLELLSHQNLADMRLGLDPRFKFIAARAVYKGIAKFLAMEQGREIAIQPLPPDHMAIEMMEGQRVKLSWQPVNDPLETSALASEFRVYMKEENRGFGQGVATKEPEMVIDLPDTGKVYSFRVTALNAGGESFPGETLSAGIIPGTKPVLVVNAFDRISGPAFFDKGDMAGIAWWEDEGVPYMKDLSLTGNQYDYDRNSEWIHDDNPGWGASHADLETIVNTGNTFDFPAVHGKAILNAGYSFVSVSDEAIESGDFKTDRYPFMDVIFGEERGQQAFGDTGVANRVFTGNFIHAIKEYTSKGGSVFMSGAYIGTDMHQYNDSSAIHFASEVLHFIWRSNHATHMGLVKATDEGFAVFPSELSFNTSFDAGTYRVESPDAIEPWGKGSLGICRYASGSTNAGIAYKGRYSTVVLGFPFETIVGDQDKNELMKRIINFFNTPK